MCRNKSSNRGIQFGKDLLVWGLVLIVIAAIAIGQDEQVPAPEAAPAPVVQQGNAEVNTVVAANVDEPKPAESVAAVSAPAEPCEAKITTDGKIKSISFKKDMRIQEALQFLAARYQKNIVPSSKVDGMITITTLYDVTFEQALNAILGTNFKYEQEDDFINVYTADEYKKIKEDVSRMEYRLFTLYYVSAAEAQKLVKPLMSSNSKIEVTTAAVKDFPIGESISTGSGGGDTTAMNDTIIVYDYPENIERVADVLGAVDVRPKQVLIEATILAATLTEDMQVGIDWGNFADVNGAHVVASLGGVGSVTKHMDAFKSAGSSQVDKTGGMTVGITLGNVAAFIRAVETVTDVTILANPKILAVNKQLGQVYIGTKIGYKSQTTQTQTSTTEQVGFLDTGTKLSFRPYIGDDGYIRMDIHPKDSSGELSALGVPDETSAELVTNIMVKDGQTIIIGGLFRDKVTNKRTQIPLLGNLPFLGSIFRGTGDSVVRQEVMVLLTPHIIEEPEATEGLARVDDIRLKRFGAKDALQGIGRAKLAENHYAKAAQSFVEGDNETALKELNVALTLRPTYLEALRLKERIISQTNPEEAKKLERVIQDSIDSEEAPNWQRR